MGPVPPREWALLKVYYNVGISVHAAYQHSDWPANDVGHFRMGEAACLQITLEMWMLLSGVVYNIFNAHIPKPTLYPN